MNENKSKIEQLELVTEGIGQKSMLPKETDYSKKSQNKTNATQSGSSSQTKEQIGEKGKGVDNK